MVQVCSLPQKFYHKYICPNILIHKNLGLQNFSAIMVYKHFTIQLKQSKIAQNNKSLGTCTQAKYYNCLPGTNHK